MLFRNTSAKDEVVALQNRRARGTLRRMRPRLADSSQSAGQPASTMVGGSNLLARFPIAALLIRRVPPVTEFEVVESFSPSVSPFLGQGPTSTTFVWMLR